MTFPQNEQLYDSISKQVRARHGNKMSQNAGREIAEEYAREGGQMVGSKKEANPKLLDKEKEAEDRKKQKIAAQKRKKKQSNLL
jgi:general stress protein YciG